MAAGPDEFLIYNRGPKPRLFLFIQGGINLVFKIRLQRLFSKTSAVIAFAFLVFAACMVFFNYAGNMTALFFESLRASMKSGAKIVLVSPNPFIFNWQEFKWWYLISGIFSIAFSIRFAYRMKVNFTPLSDRKTKGSRSFATIPALQTEFRSVPEKSEKISGGGGFPVSRYKGRIFIDDSPVNNLIIGTTRSGKTQMLVVPAIDIYSRAEKQASMIIADPKGELAASSAATLKRRGYDVQVFDLMNFMGLSYNPLQLVLEAYMRDDKAEAQLLANTLSYILFHDPNAKDKTWENWSIALTNALILAVTIDCCAEAEKYEDESDKKRWYGKVNMYSVARLLVDLGETDNNGKSLLDKFFLSRGLDDIARIQYSAVAFAAGKTKGNIFANTNSQLIKFTMEKVAKMTSKNTLDLENIGFNIKQPTAVFLVMPDYDRSNQFLATIFISQLYYVLSKKCSMIGGKCPREVVFLLDEFGNITPIPEMAHILNVCLGRNIRFDMIVQAYSQIYHLYGEQDGRSIIAGCGNQIYLLTIEANTAKEFSSLIGNKTITSYSRNGRGNLSLDKNISEHPDTQPLLNPNELMELKPGESVVVRVTKRTDLKGRKITPNPIFNHGKTIMKYSYQYLAGDFPEASFQSLRLEIHCGHKDTSLNNILYSPVAKPQTTLEETPMPFDAPLKQTLSEKQIDFIRKLFRAENFDENTIDFTMTMTQFDEFLQELLDNRKISQSTFDDVYTVLKDSA